MRAKLPGADIVANPGCYPTAILLALAPLLQRRVGSLPGATINVSAASGVTGAGYSAAPDLLFAEVAEDFRAYGVGNEHRHLAEMRAVADELGGRATTFSSRRTCCRSRAEFSRRSRCPSIATPTIRLALWRERLRGRAVHRDRRAAADAARRRSAQRRAHQRHQGRQRQAADAHHHLGDRQPHEGRGRTGGAEREPAARADEQAGLPA